MASRPFVSSYLRSTFEGRVQNSYCSGMDLKLHRPHQAFISHARRNPHLAGRLAKEIKKLLSVKVWIDEKDLNDKNVTVR